MKLKLCWFIVISSLAILFCGLNACSKEQPNKGINLEEVGIEFSDYYKDYNHLKSCRIYYAFDMEEDFGDVDKLSIITPIDTLKLTMYHNYTVNDSIVIGDYCYNTAFSFWDFPSASDNLYFFYLSQKWRLQNSSLLINFRDTSLVISSTSKTKYHYYLNGEEIHFPQDLEKIKGYWNDLYKDGISESVGY